MERFRKHEHLRSPREFQQVYDRRRSVSDAAFIVYARENSLACSRVGFSVSRKYGGAVQRNRLRRLLREAYRLTRAELPTGLDLVFIPRTQNEPTLEELKRSLTRLVKQAAKKLERDKASQAPEQPATGTVAESSAATAGPGTDSAAN
jgi:ribonuclease P protein component